MTPSEEFTARLLSSYWDNDSCDVDGADIEDMAVKAGLAIERPVTQDDIDGSEHLQEWDMEPGDTWFFASPELLALMRQLT